MNSPSPQTETNRPFGEWRRVCGYTSHVPRSFVGRDIGSLSFREASIVRQHEKSMIQENKHTPALNY
jgi:hypothetical protein